MKNVIRVNLNGDLIYMTEAAYAEFRLQLSTGDFHTHKKTRLKKLPKSIPSWRVRDAVYYSPRLKYPTVESIIDAYNIEDQCAEEYSESEDSTLAEFVSSFFYGEASLSHILDGARLEEETIDLLKKYHNQNNLKSLHELLSSVSDLSCIDIYYRDGELLSATIGDQEHQVDDTLSEAYQTLTPEEKAQVKKETSAGMFSSNDDGRYIYTSDNYHRWVLICDEEKLVKKLKKLVKSQPKLKEV